MPRVKLSQEHIKILIKEDCATEMHKYDVA